jgi:hypothetical protein
MYPLLREYTNKSTQIIQKLNKSTQIYTNLLETPCNYNLTLMDIMSPPQS